MPNRLLFVRQLTEDRKKIEDAKASEYSKKKRTKKDTTSKKKGAEAKPPSSANVDEEQFENRIYWSFGNPPIAFSIEAMFQGDPYPNPAKEHKEEIDPKEAKGKSKKKDPKDIPDMLIPDPIAVTAESNRKLQLKMSNIIVFI